MTDFWYALGDLLQASFEVFPLLGNSANAVFLGVVSIAFLYWMGQLVKFKRAGEQ